MKPGDETKTKTSDAKSTQQFNTNPVSNLKPEEITFNLFCSPPVHHQENKLTDQPNQFETQVSLSNLFVHQSNQ